MITVEMPDALSGDSSYSGAPNADAASWQRSSDIATQAHARLRSRACADGTLVTDRAGRFWRGDAGLADRLNKACLAPHDHAALMDHGLIPGSELGRLATIYAEARRQQVPTRLDYLILVPSLRCNLACSYCQVSRANVDANGFDWSEETLAGVCNLIGSLGHGPLKIEFQGGEPTLRPDLIEAVINAVPTGAQAEFVICTNLQKVDDRTLALFDRPDVTISTSLDGPLPLHARQRQGEVAAARHFHETLKWLMRRYGPGKISALPTLDPAALPGIDALIDSYLQLGLTSIFLRPINYQGFARKRHPTSRDTAGTWGRFHRAFIDRIIARNWAEWDHHLHSDLSRTSGQSGNTDGLGKSGKILEETYFSLVLRRIFRPGDDRHVDLRSPNPIGRDYIVIDHDGLAYPSDEARMLTRAGVMDLAIGDIHSGWDTAERATLEQASTNLGDPTCEACAYQPYCGRDIFDDIARYGTIDLPRQDTEFCRRHLDLFDFAFALIHSPEPAVQFSLRRWLRLPGETGPLVPA